MIRAIIIISFILLYVIYNLIKVIRSEELLDIIPYESLDTIQKYLALILVLQFSIFYLSIIIIGKNMLNNIWIMIGKNMLNNIWIEIK